VRVAALWGVVHGGRVFYGVVGGNLEQRRIGFAAVDVAQRICGFAVRGLLFLEEITTFRLDEYQNPLVDSIGWALPIPSARMAGVMLLPCAAPLLGNSDGYTKMSYHFGGAARLAPRYFFATAWTLRSLALLRRVYGSLGAWRALFPQLNCGPN